MANDTRSDETHIEPSPLPLVEGEGDAVSRRQDHFRELVLGARDDPDNTLMPGGETVTEHRKRIHAELSEKGRVEAEQARDRMREQSTASDPVYASDTVVQTTAVGTAVILAPANIEGRPDDGEASGGQRDANGGASGSGAGGGQDIAGMPLPDDLPFRSELVKAGVNDYRVLRGLDSSDVAGLPGLDPAAAIDIRRYIESHS